MHTLIWLFGIPLAASLLMFMLPGFTSNFLKRLAIGLSLVPLAILFMAWPNVLGAEINIPWLSALSINFHLKMDQLSLLFVLLTLIVVPYSLIADTSRQFKADKTFYALVLLTQALLIGFFTAQDLVLFTIFWEALLIPLYFIISVWGGPKRQATALKFIIYMIAGSTLMVAGVLALYFAHVATQGTGTFNIPQLASISSQLPYTTLVGAVFLLAFAVKTPLFPFHGWLPDTYTEAPTAGTILLSALLSKAGIYGFLRIGGEIFPQVMQEWSPLLIALAIIGVFYGAFAAWSQNDFKRLLAYSSFSHVNLVLVGIFVWSHIAISGGILQAVNHGLTITALFLAAGWLQERVGSTAFQQVSGLAKYMPHLCWLTLFFVVSSIALPGLNNFVGEFMILFGLFTRNPWLAALLTLSVILSVIYMLRWMEKIYFGEPAPQKLSWSDISIKEMALALPLVLLLLWIGIYPASLLDNYIDPAATKIIDGTVLEKLP